ncbi:MAG: hypothetical protein DRO40_06395 [Thermoprotei archaeon]|nr:MAG: hypothetical protein DRO40_06395 [Thermoprotei archaeon]
MQLIGLVGSGSTTLYTPIIIWDQVEHLAKEEQLVLIEDGKRGLRYLGVLRGVKRYEPFLNIYRRTSYVDNPELVETGTLPHSSGYSALIGIIHGNRLREVDLPPNPGSKVYVVESSSDLGLDLGEGLRIGYHKYSGIDIPLDPLWITYHVGIVGATGTGKSRLVRALIDEVLEKTMYRIIVFDHTGLDYALYYKENIVDASNIVLDISLIADLMLSRTGLYQPTYEPYILYSILKYIFEYYSSHEEGSKIIDELKRSSKTIRVHRLKQKKIYEEYGGFSDFLNNIDFESLLETMARHPIKWDRSWFRRVAMDSVGELRGRESSKIRLGVAIDIKLGDGFFTTLSNRNLLPRDIVDRAWKDRLVVVDLSTEDIATRRYIVAGVIYELWKRVETNKASIDTLVVVDEAHNYACRNCGEAHYALTRVAREGRKWGFGLILATQRIMDIDPEIRSNINTWFFSKLQTPNDYNELKGYMDLAGITEQSLAALARREFYLAGLMNPLKVPILIRVKEVR